MKKWYASKTVWFFLLSLVVAFAGFFGFADFAPSALQLEIMAIVVPVVGLVLRLITHKSVEL